MKFCTLINEDDKLIVAVPLGKKDGEVQVEIHEFVNEDYATEEICRAEAELFRAKKDTEIAAKRSMKLRIEYENNNTIPMKG